MKKYLLKTLSVLLVIVMLMLAIVSCSPHNEGIESGSESSSEGKTEESQSRVEGSEGSEHSSESDKSETNTDEDETSTDEDETSTDEDETSPSVSGEHGPLVEHAHSLANGVQAFFADAERKYYNVKNKEMTLSYSRSAEEAQQVTYIKNTKGKSYVENTMDVFIRMKNGSVFYASDSIYDADANLFRYGYYYFESNFSGQSFIPKDIAENSINKTSLNLKTTFSKSASPRIKMSVENDGLKISIIDINDPYALFEGFEYSTADYNLLTVTIKSNDVGEFRVYPDIGDGFQSDQLMRFTIEPDGEFHTFVIPLFDLDDEGVYDGDITRIRIDPEGNIGDSVVVSEISLSKVDTSSIPAGVLINRKFHVYSDKMHHEIQFNVAKDVENVESVGTYTEIDKETVSKLLVVDKNEKTYTSLDGIDWSNIVAVAFDIKETGVFGYILPSDGKGGKISVAEKDGKYVIIQETSPEDNTLIASPEGSDNGNDLHTGFRVYTDENHDFEKFLFETLCEQNPLNGKNVKVSNTFSDNGGFAGYDSLRGIYILNVGAPVGHFWTPYDDPNKHYKINFTISAGDIARDIYIMSETDNGLLECAALLDEDMMMLPMPIEVIKNFDDMTIFYNKDDAKFSEAIIPLTLETDKKYEYNLINLYQNWGQFPLKQISQIPFHVPYYHLSTGVTETNCITPWFQYTHAGKPQIHLHTLPDHRPMSAPMWETEPQHTFGGTHYWLEYTDSDGRFISVESTSNVIDSFGPTYAEVQMSNISDDGKIKVTYTHMEMPQTDENRTYYIMEYEVLEDVTIKDVKNNFQFYRVQSNDVTGRYQKVSYLDENNKSAYAAANKDASKEPEYRLGDISPYFTFYEMPGVYDKATNPEGYTAFRLGYANMAFIIHSYDFTVDGKDYKPEFLLVNSQHELKLTLNAETLTLKAGDKITINAIVLPWGSQDSIYDGSNGLAPDQNVLDVRENTCLDPLKAISDTDEIIASTYLPKIKSKDGKYAEFTLTGGRNENGRHAEGQYNATVRVYGFDMLTAPKVEEYVDGKWIEYVLSSKDTPIRGSYHYYDGYCVHYDGDGTYSYSFVVDMTEGRDRKFRIAANTDFEGWPAEVPVEAVNYLKLYLDYDEIRAALGTKVATRTAVEGRVSYVSIYQPKGLGEFYTTIFAADDSVEETGQYFVYKYRIPKTNTASTPYLEFFTSTSTTNIEKNHNFRIPTVCDGEWHVVVIDVSSISAHPAFKPVDDKYTAQYIRADFFNDMSGDSGEYNADNHVDFAYIGMDSSLDEIYKLNSDLETVMLYVNGVPTEINTATGEAHKPSYVHSESGYTEAKDRLFYGILDYVNEEGNKGGAITSVASLGGYPIIIKGSDLMPQLSIGFSGWCIVDGGISRYVWSIDGGKSWNDIEGSDALGSAADAIYSNAQSKTENGFTNKDADIINGGFQNAKKLTVDLSAYENQTIDLIIALVPAKDTKTLIPMFVVDDLLCEKYEPPVYVSEFDSASEYEQSFLAFGAFIDTLNDKVNKNESGDKVGVLELSSLISIEENCYFKIEGWSVVDGGISKYIWTADKGKTWHDCEGTPKDANDAIITVAKNKATKFLAGETASKKNACFQKEYALGIDLIDYRDSTEPIQIWVCAVNETDTTQATLLFKFNNVKMSGN